MTNIKRMVIQSPPPNINIGEPQRFEFRGLINFINPKFQSKTGSVGYIPNVTCKW
jgi:hypothetical protein